MDLAYDTVLNVVAELFRYGKPWTENEARRILEFREGFARCLPDYARLGRRAVQAMAEMARSRMVEDVVAEKIPTKL